MSSIGNSTLTRFSHSFVWLLTAAILVAGCSTTQYRESADKEAYAAIAEKSPAVPNMAPAFTIDAPKNEAGLDDLPKIKEADPALGESAPLLMIGMVAFIVDVPHGVSDPSTVLPVQIYLWARSPERAFVERTSGAIIVLLGFLLVMNAAAVILRKRFERRW